MDKQLLLAGLALAEESEGNRRSITRKNIFFQMKKPRSEAIVQYYTECIKAICSMGLSYIRSIWMKARSGAWWDDIVLSHMQFSDADWISNFRMDRQTSLEVCRLVDDDLKPKLLFFNLENQFVQKNRWRLQYTNLHHVKK